MALSKGIFNMMFLMGKIKHGSTSSPRTDLISTSLSAFTVTCVSGLELALMQTDVLADWWSITHLLDSAVGIMLVSLMAFIWVYFGTG
jgi:hypothetical protein